METEKLSEREREGKRERERVKRGMNKTIRINMEL